MILAKRLTPKQRIQIQADYTELQDYFKVGRLYGVYASTIKRIVDKYLETQKRADNKKEQHTQDILDFMNSRKNVLFDITEKVEERLKTLIPVTTDIQRLMTAYGLLILI